MVAVRNSIWVEEFPSFLADIVMHDMDQENLRLSHKKMLDHGESNLLRHDYDYVNA